VERESCDTGKPKVLFAYRTIFYTAKHMRYYQAIIILLVAFAVLSGIQAAVQAVDISTLPPEWQPLWQGISYVFTTSAATVLFTFIRNILGFAENYFEADKNKRTLLHYEAGKLAATWMKYEVYLKGYTAAIQALTTGTPYYQHAVYIAGAIGLLTDLITKAIKDLAP